MVFHPSVYVNASSCYRAGSFGTGDHSPGRSAWQRDQTERGGTAPGDRINDAGYQMAQGISPALFFWVLLDINII